MRNGARRFVLGAASATVVLVVCAGPGAAAPPVASFPQGGWSAGAQGGYALYNMKDLNAALTAASGSDYEELKHGWEGVVDVRYAFRRDLFVGLEGGYTRGSADDLTGTRGTAVVSGVPLQVIAGGAIGRPSDLALRIVAGLGVILDGGLTAGGEDLGSGTGLLTSLGAEVELRITPAFAVTAQALVRQAKVSDPGALDYDLDFSGGSVRLGARGYFGGGAQ
jgi:hypothetical protein